MKVGWHVLRLLLDTHTQTHTVVTNQIFQNYTAHKHVASTSTKVHLTVSVCILHPKHVTSDVNDNNKVQTVLGIMVIINSIVYSFFLGLYCKIDCGDDRCSATSHHMSWTNPLSHQSFAVLIDEVLRGLGPLRQNNIIHPFLGNLQATKIKAWEMTRMKYKYKDKRGKNKIQRENSIKGEKTENQFITDL